MRFGRLLIMHGLARAAGRVNGPSVFPVKQDRHLWRGAGSAQRGEILQHLAHARDFAEHACVRPAVMVDHCAVKFFAAAAALAPLEILHGIRSMCDGLDGCQFVLARRFQAVDGPPVDLTGRIFHHQEGCPLHTAHQVVRHGRVDGHGDIAARVRAPGGVIVPGNDVEDVFEFRVVEAIIKAHQIGGDGQIAAARAHGGLFPGAEIHRAVRDKAAPVNYLAVHEHLPARRGRLDLFPVRIRMAPETGPPGVVERVE